MTGSFKNKIIFLIFITFGLCLVLAANKPWLHRELSATVTGQTPGVGVQNLNEVDGLSTLLTVPFLTDDSEPRYERVCREGWLLLRLENFEKYDSLISAASKKYRVDYALVKAIIKAESNFNPMAISRSGARGLMQLTPETARALGVSDSFRPEDNIQGGVRHLRYLLDLFEGNLHLALAGYNAGEKAVIEYDGVPPYEETQVYVRRVMHYFRDYRRESPKLRPRQHPFRPDNNES